MSRDVRLLKCRLPMVEREDMTSLTSRVLIQRASILALAAAAVGCGASTAIAKTPSVTLYPVPAAYTAGSPDIEPAMMLAPNGSGDWFVLGDAGSKDSVINVTTNGKFHKVNGSLPDGDTWVAGVVADGAGWLQAEGGGLWKVTTQGQATDYGTPGGDEEDMTLGPDGALYLTDNSAGAIVRCLINSGPPAECAPDQLSSLFSALAPAAIADVDNVLFFTTNNSELGALTGTGAQSGPIADSGGKGPVSPAAGSMVVGPNGLLYAAGGAAGSSQGNATDLVAINPRTGAVVKTFGKTAGLPGKGSPSALTSAGGNIWFLDDGTDNVGELDVKTGKISEYALPGLGNQLAYNAAIAPGPSGSNTVFFSVQDANGNPVIGEVNRVQDSAPAGHTVTPQTEH